MSRQKRHASGHGLTMIIMAFYLLAFLLLAARDGSLMGYILAGAVPSMIFLGSSLLPRLFSADRLLMSLVNFLCALGILLLYVLDPSYALQQAIAYGIGLVAMIFCIELVRGLHSGGRVIWLLMPLSLVLLSLPLWLGQDVDGVKGLVSLGSFPFRPGAVDGLFLILTLSFFLSRRSWIPWLLFLLACLGILLLQQDLETALLYYAVSLLMFWTATGSLPFSLAGLAGGAFLAWYGFQAFAHVQLQVSVWQNPLANEGSAASQTLQGLTAISSGGLWGTGLGRSVPFSLPALQTGSIFTLLCGQFGGIFALCVLCVYALLLWRGASIAIASRRRFHGLLAIGAVALFGLQTFMALGGVLQLIPLTNQPLPFLSFDSASLVASLGLAGLIQGVASLNEDDLTEDEHLMMLGRG